MPNPILGIPRAANRLPAANLPLTGDEIIALVQSSTSRQAAVDAIVDLARDWTEIGLQLGTPTGGDLGAGTVNASVGYYVNGVAFTGSIGATAARPVFVSGSNVMYAYYDTTLDKPIWWNGSAWKDATGTTV